MYKEYWGLKLSPFENVPDPRFLYLSSNNEDLNNSFCIDGECTYCTTIKVISDNFVEMKIDIMKQFNSFVLGRYFNILINETELE